MWILILRDFIEEASGNRSDRLLPNDLTLLSPSSCSPLLLIFYHLFETLSACKFWDCLLALPGILVYENGLPFAYSALVSPFGVSISSISISYYFLSKF